MMLPKLILTDIDGVWTDGGMYYSNDGIEFKKFNTSDSAGVLFCHILGIKVGIVTGENSEAVKKRAEKLKIEHVFVGVKNKKKVVETLLSNLGLNWNDVAYIGDDLNDIEVLQKARISATPQDAPDYIKKYAKVILSKNGGDGVFREFVELIIEKENTEKAIEDYLKNLKSFSQ
ncbi:KdsC family phosphatase [Wocania ichthyoenteri]|uniref:KdsC family phosphatase n=1 Tax=Wocania ichthyoenteri TaxID=1230531 RepID=UPI00053EA0C7|nr:HAD-IA family hydrolase [Wocania ichthyoenteri]